MKPFEQALRLMLDLHKLMAAGKGDEPEADEIRDRLEGVKLSDGEEALLGDVSYALYGDADVEKFLRTRVRTRKTGSDLPPGRDASDEMSDFSSSHTDAVRSEIAKLDPRTRLGSSGPPQELCRRLHPQLALCCELPKSHEGACQMSRKPWDKAE